jgi:large subunit ribosomal protein L23
MNQERLLKLLVGPHVSEKTSRCTERSNQYVFKVEPSSTKREIKLAVEAMFNVQVLGVTTLNVKPKAKRFGQIMGQRKGWKKAYIKLKEGQSINFAGTE